MENDIQEKRNVFESLFVNILPEKEWNNEQIELEKDLQTFLIKNIWWLENLIKNMFDFTNIEFIGKEYSVFKYYGNGNNRICDKYDLAFRHGEDIIIVELKTGYNSKGINGFKQLIKYKENFQKKYKNKVYIVLVTTYMTKKILNNYRQKYNNEVGLILLDKHFDYNDGKFKYWIDFSNTRYGMIGNE